MLSENYSYGSFMKGELQKTVPFVSGSYLQEYKCGTLQASTSLTALGVRMKNHGLLHGRQQDLETRAFIFKSGSTDLSPMQGNDLLYDGKAYARPLVFIS